MVKVWKYLVFTVFYFILIGSCVMSSVVDGIDGVIESKTTMPDNNVNEYKKGCLSLKILNTAPNTSLQIDTMEICNIIVKDDVNGGVKKGNIFFDSTVMELPVQKFNSWSPDVLPKNSNDMFVKLDGKMYTYIADKVPVVLCNGPMYFTFNGSITENNTTEIEFVVYDRCPLYFEVDGKMVKVLQTISFEVSVDDWEEIF